MSVVIAARNAEATLRETIESVLGQSMPDFEVLVCDDASSDRTPDIVRSIDDGRVKLLANQVNLGAGPSRDRAIIEASGHWIAFIDADDAWLPTRLETLLHAARNEPDIAVFDDILICHHTSKGLKPWRTLRGPRAFGSQGGAPVEVAAHEWVGSDRFLVKLLIPTAFIKRHRIRHSSLRFMEDIEFLLRMIAAGIRLRYVPEALYLYRMSPDSMSTIAGRETMKRDMLTQATQMFLQNPAMMRALEHKIAYRDFTMLIKKARFVQAARCAVARPSLVTDFLRLAYLELMYQAHRRISGGTGR